MNQEQTARKLSSAKKQKRLYLVHLEDHVEESLTTHDLFVETESQEDTRRAAMIEQLKVRVRAGTYIPNYQLIAERILAA